MTASQRGSSRAGRATQAPPVGKMVMVAMILCGLLVAAYAVFRFSPVIEISKQRMSEYNPKLAWYFSRASGIVAYILLTISMVWGLILSTKISKEYTPAPAVLALHNAVSWIAVALGALHGFALMFDTYYTYNLFDVLVPFTGPYHAGWVGLGIISLYVMLISSASFAWQAWLGQRGWRWIHYSTFPIYGLVTLHGLMSGTDSWSFGTDVMYIGSVLTVLFLINYRVIAGKEASAAARRQGAAIPTIRQAEEASVMN